VEFEISKYLFGEHCVADLINPSEKKFHFLTDDVRMYGKPIP
jgi:hypothetical protein